MVESIPVPDDVKRLGRRRHALDRGLDRQPGGGGRRRHQDRSATISCRWSTGPAPTSTGRCRMAPRALRFDQDRFAAFDLISCSGRRRAKRLRDARAHARAKRARRDDARPTSTTLTRNIAAGLPGVDHRCARSRRDSATGSQPIAASTPRVARSISSSFSQRVAPVAEALGVKLTLHPDDPPRPLFGLPRIASTAEDYQALFDAVPSPANGMCFCTGSLGVARATTICRRWRGASRRASISRICARPSAKPTASFYRGRPSRRRRRHGRGAEGAAGRGPHARAGGQDRVPARITATACWTISRTSAPIPAIRRSAGSRASPNCAAPSAPSSTPVDTSVTVLAFAPMASSAIRPSGAAR